MLKKFKSTEIEFAPVCFSSTAKTVINHKFSLDKSFQEILYRIDNWINQGSGQIVESIESQYINGSNYRPLSGGSYIKLPAELRCYDSHLIFDKLKNFDVKIDVIPNRLEKYMAFFKIKTQSLMTVCNL